MLIREAKEENMQFDLPAKIVTPLLEWYGKNARVLPWRENPDPYRVWVSEIMLQQTRVEAVKPYFERFIAALPDLEHLAAAPEPLLMKLWEGLGYYSRVRNLQKAARMILTEFGGVFPSEREALLRLPGIGAYTAGAIASISFGRPEPAVDGNVVRVLVRLTGCRAPGGSIELRSAMAEALRGIYPAGASGEFTQALMELGATVCLPNGVPKCASCPLAGFCVAREGGFAEALPVREKKAARRVEFRTVLLLRNNGRFALARRPERGVLAGMWEFPALPGALDPAAVRERLSAWELEPGPVKPGPEARHIFTHLEWRMNSFFVDCGRADPDFRWVTPEELEREIALPSAFRKFARALPRS